MSETSRSASGSPPPPGAQRSVRRLGIALMGLAVLNVATINYYPIPAGYQIHLGKLISIAALTAAAGWGLYRLKPWGYHLALAFFIFRAGKAALSHPQRFSISSATIFLILTIYLVNRRAVFKPVTADPSMEPSEPKPSEAPSPVDQ